ncbi:MAG TPA: hypothetical protein VGC55_17380 [Dokdonella sp.]
MDLSNQTLLLLVVLLLTPVVMVAIINLIFRPRSGIARGLGGALFIGLCWVATIALIVQKVSD